MKVDVFQGLEIHRFPLALEVHHLAAHQPRCPRRQRELPHHLQQPLGGHPGAAQGHHLEGPGQQGVAGQDGIGLTEHLVVCWPTPAQVVVVHGGEVVMDERHGVNHLQRHRGGQGQVALPTGELKGRQTEDRPQPLAPGQQGITHGFPQRLRPLQSQGSIQGSLHAKPCRLQVSGEIERPGGHGSGCRLGSVLGRAHRRSHDFINSAAIVSGR